MSKGDKIALVVLVVYVLMIGITHGYVSSRNEPDHRCATDKIGATYCWTNDVDSVMANGLAATLWPIWWPSHITQELLK